MLSAQCTDERVNKVTPPLFAKYPDPFAMQNADDLETMLFSTGHYKVKARHVRDTSRMLVERFHGKVPQAKEELMALPGVGQKTAHVLLGELFGAPHIVVDTHVLRLCRRIGISHEQNPEKLERILAALVPRKERTHFGHLMITHGRACCRARSPACAICPIRQRCASVAP